MGSVRAVLDGDGMVQGRNDYLPFGESWSAGGQSSAGGSAASARYKFNGKELQTTGGVDLLDYGARMYDSNIGRWLTQDPLAEKYFSMSSYNYCANNPIRFIDPDGMAWKSIVDKDADGNEKTIGYEWIPEEESYDKKGNLLPGLYNQAIFFTDNGTFDQGKETNIGSATAIVFLADGTKVEFDASTRPARAEKYATVPEGDYEATVGLHRGGQPYTALRMHDIGDTQDKIQLGVPNPSDPSRSYAQGINIHKAGGGNTTGLTSKKLPVSAGCLLIDVNNWNNFIGYFNNPAQKSNPVRVTVSRSRSSAIIGK